MEYAEQLGLGTQHYTLVSIDGQTNVDQPATSAALYNVFSLDGKKLLTNANSLGSLPKGTYIVNGEKMVIE